MSSTSSQPQVPRDVERDGRWALVVRVASSPQFSKAPQLREILLYVCRRALADPSAIIREHEIGCGVLGRKADFNPNEDNIVRVRVSHLRKRLEEHFRTDGRHEALRITIPKGGYVPRFDLRAKAESVTLLPGSTSSRAVPLLAAGVVGLTLFCMYLLLRPQHLTASGPAKLRNDPLWSRLFDSAQPTAIVVADSCLVMMQDLLHTDLSVTDYAGGRYPGAWLKGGKDRELRPAIQLLSERQYTSLADLNLSAKLLEIGRQCGSAGATVHFARHVNIRDFKTGNFIFIGSRRGIPWTGLFEQQLNFTMQEDRRTHRFYFQNRSPKPGEDSRYPAQQNNSSGQSYSDIALLPNLSNTGSVLILSGLAMVDTEAAGEVLTRSDGGKWLAQVLGTHAVRGRYFEVLLKTRAVGGVAEGSEVVAYRIIGPDGAAR